MYWVKDILITMQSLYRKRCLGKRYDITNRQLKHTSNSIPSLYLLLIHIPGSDVIVATSTTKMVRLQLISSIFIPVSLSEGEVNHRDPRVASHNRIGKPKFDKVGTNHPLKGMTREENKIPYLPCFQWVIIICHIVGNRIVVTDVRLYN